MATKKVTIGATGDILLHKRVYEKARKKDGSFDFAPMFENVKHLFDKDHLIIVNQESIIGGEELGLSDFPNFNSPVEIGYQLKDMNVDIANIANNHVLDHGEKGILSSIENWEKIGIPYVGAYKSFEDQETLRIINKNGLRVCFLSYTKGLGGKKVPKGKEYLVNQHGVTKFAGHKDVAGVRRLIDQIRKRDLADVVVLSIHFGKEYQMKPTAYQLETASNLADAGADVIIGHHPHVVQPFDFLVNSKGETVFTAYSLGNFFSGQKGLYRQIGGYMTIDVEKEGNNRLLKIDNPTFNLTYVDSSDKKDYKMHLLKDIVDTQTSIKTDVGEFDAKEVYERMVNHTKMYLPNMEVK
ncbi:CapA family protein [Pseudogracilibacillus sp. ICA-222130]|uniref:CapA family protein n=1 Tax=Pseudogracilibacillus sp. ICA-222130 TaxID=3134655 RepID=UPI0030BCFAA8